MTVPTSTSVLSVVPADSSWWPSVWAWMQDAPHANMDDDSPQTPEAFSAVMDQRCLTGELIFGLIVDGMRVGVMGYLPINHRLAMLHGICLRPECQGQGYGTQAVLHLLAHLKSVGVEKVTATYYATNQPIRALLQKMGFRDEGFLVDHITQQGHPVSVYCVSCFLKG